VVAFKLLGITMGNSIHSMTAVVTSFMGGLALGSWLAGRILGSRDPEITYAVLETLAAFCFLAFPEFFHLFLSQISCFSKALVYRCLN
jgi:hypothetical protein